MAGAAERAGRPAGLVRLLPVTKGFPVEAIREGFALGLRDFGESRVQEAEGKIRGIDAGARWHLIGHLQSNKARRAVELFSEIHSIDSARLAGEVARRAESAGREPACYVEVNTSGDATKFGVAPSDALELLSRVRELSAIRLAGLMTIGPLDGGASGARAAFRSLASLRDAARRAGLLGEDAGLSMGMSDDFEIAIEEGATIVRIGSALWGGRPQ